jgi:predicted RNA binding protein YcfA (HicA-like mRNA interferase family)
MRPKLGNLKARDVIHALEKGGFYIHASRASFARQD